MNKIIDAYYADNAKKLHLMVDRILMKFGGVADKDIDDFYSLANEVFVNVLEKYDESQMFDTYLYSCLSNKIKSEITRRNRYKRKADRIAVSIDTPLDDDESMTLADVIEGCFDMDRTVFGEETEYNSKISRYLDRLSNLQRTIVQLLSESYRDIEIQRMLHITQQEYVDNMAAIHSYENIRVLL